MNIALFFACHPRLARLFRRKFASEISCRCDLAFVIRFDGGVPKFSLGPPGHELACYVPDGVSWRQVNYGQGEGQVDIDGREWGFYLAYPDEVQIVLHDGEMKIDTAVAFVRDVASTLAGSNDGFEVHIRGYSRLVPANAI